MYWGYGFIQNSILVAAILKIQDGRHLKWIVMFSNGLCVWKNVDLDTKIMSVCGLEANLQDQTDTLAAI